MLSSMDELQEALAIDCVKWLPRSVEGCVLLEGIDGARVHAELLRAAR
jgi:hypothetical protein